ncbi:MAG TPA: hypothetical protein VMZ00_09040 [Sporichthya sp.]|nr:hypothetical protein [Sporichthya sp.]
MRQLGEIRIGRVVDTGRISQKTQRPIMRPEKLDKFRLTSASKPILEQVAELYGGTVQPWTPANGGPSEWEVYTEVDRLPVLVPPRDPVTLWYEQYKGSKCVRRCDGITEQKSDQACLCNPDKRTCQITMRLNVMLPQVRGLGVWLLTSHGFFASSELPEVAEFLSRTNGYVDAWLTMEEKQVPIVDDNGREGTARFMVPKLDVDLTPAELLAGQGVSAAAMEATAARAAVTGNAPAAIEAPTIDTPEPPTAEDFLVHARAAATFTAFKAIWDEATKSNISPTQAQSDEMTAIGKRLQAAQQQRQANASAGSEALSAPAADAEVLWQQIVSASPWPMSELRDKFLTASGGVAPEDAGVQDLTAFLGQLSTGAVA